MDFESDTRWAGVTQTAPESPALLVHRDFGPFITLEIVGTGGSGIVYRAIDRRSSTSAAVKTTRGDAEPQRSALQREVDFLRCCADPGVVAVRETCFDEAVPWFAMDLLRGSLLRDLVERRPDKRSRGVAMEEEAGFVRRTAEGLAIARELAASLSHIHACGVVHCDVKPENAFVVEGGRVVVFDFDAACWLDDASVASGDERLTLGTWSYMAPECRSGTSFDQRADVYAFGCVLHELAYGHPHSPRAQQHGVERSAWATALSGLIAELTAFDAADRPRCLSECSSRLAAIELELAGHV